ncbi:MAG: cyclic pyranopterin monophosphate synthase MoaC [Bacteroidota bacterium]|nr:cyclic pyranopterin monophosphate synthase MoaC [Bacteroidota bacterium]MDP4193312.1 cyclic pyranopterin monophosphate synthase MoaC [Bacteroidota bacterium]MDP4196538.1 cyclic pyranopterin monophosphate synthase MoaC [Bacteroidota bacterium]
MGEFTHTDSEGKARMVDVTSKAESERAASAFAEVHLGKDAFESVKNNSNKKGDVLSVAKIAGIQAAKRTDELIPLCHNIFISSVDLTFELNRDKKTIEITSLVKTVSRTGVEMEALTAVSIAALTIYDMCKAIDKAITISDICLLTKSGGKSGTYSRKDL